MLSLTRRIESIDDFCMLTKLHDQSSITKVEATSIGPEMSLDMDASDVSDGIRSTASYHNLMPIMDRTSLFTSSPPTAARAPSRTGRATTKRTDGLYRPPR